MHHTLTELINQSESGNQLAQIKLFFRQYYDYNTINAAAITCDKWRPTNLFLEGVWRLYGFNKPKSVFDEYHESQHFNFKASSTIFQQLSNQDNELGAYACNMLSLGLHWEDPLGTQYLNQAAKYGVDCAHYTLAGDAMSKEVALYHYGVSASKYNKCSLLKLVEIHLQSGHYFSPPLAIKYYRDAMSCGYDLGDISNILKLKRHDIDMTVILLEYEANRNNGEAMLALGHLYANNKKVFNLELALNWYKRVEQIDDSGHCTIENIVGSGKIDWSPKYHSLWPRLGIKIVQTHDFGHRHKQSTLLVTSFQQEVVLLLWIAKCRHFSSFDFVKSMYKNIVLAIIIHLARPPLEESLCY